MKVAGSVLDLVGLTPVVRLNRIPEPGDAEIFLKLEMFNPGGSVKDRPALNMIEEAEKAGRLKPGSVIVEPTSGNTGIGIAMVAAVKGYRCIICLPDTSTQERIALLKGYGAEVVLTPGVEGMSGAVTRAEEILSRLPNGFMPQQFKNEANTEAHRRGTAQEILTQMGGKLDGFVAGAGTGGTITGCGEILRKAIPALKIVVVEPAASPVLSGGRPGSHKIPGIGPGFVPEIINTEVYDEVERVTDEEAWNMTRRLAREEGILVGPSSGAAACAALRLAKRLGEGKRVLAVAPDTGERYFTMGIF